MIRAAHAVLVLAAALAAQGSRPSTDPAPATPTTPTWLPAAPTTRLVYARGGDRIVFGYEGGTRRAESRSMASRAALALRFDDCAFYEEDGALTCAGLCPLGEFGPAPVGLMARATHERIRILPLPAGATLKWDGSYSAQPGRSEPTRYRGELEASSEDVTVPAGSFAAARVRIVEEDPDSASPRATTYWLARGIGVVKRKGARGDLELAGVERLDAAPDAALAALVTAACARDRELAPLGPPVRSRVVALDELAWQKGRFVRVDWDAASALVREKDGAVVRFDPRSAEAWNALLDADALRVPDDAGRQRMIAFGPALLLATERLGWPCLPVSLEGPVGRLADSGGELGNVTTAQVPFDDPRAGRCRVTALVVFRDGRFADLLTRRP